MPLGKDMGAWIKDFQNSKNEKFAGKTKEERTEMAKAAYMAKYGKKEVAEATDYMKRRKAMDDYSTSKKDKPKKPYNPTSSGKTDYMKRREKDKEELPETLKNILDKKLKEIAVTVDYDDPAKLTDQMVANCKEITKEYEKLHQK